MRWKTEILENITVISKGKKHLETNDSDAKRYIQIEDLGDKFIPKYTLEKGVGVEENDVVIAWDGANAGKVGVGMIGVIGSTLARIRPVTDKIIGKYLFRFLQLKEAEIRSKRTGATIPHVNGVELRKMSFAFPDLATQQRIVAILDEADGLRRADKQLLVMHNELMQSIFIEMFGDPIKNEKGWHWEKFANVGNLDRGISKHRPRNAPELLGGIYPLIQTGDVANSEGYIRTYKSTYSELGLKQSKLWYPGTLCITIAANIAKTGILTFNACFPDSVVGFTPNKKTNVIYIQFWLSHLQEMLEATAPESAQKNINLEILRNLKLPLPPIELQDKFAKLIEEVEHQKVLVIQQQQQSEALFQSLLQKAFKGEL
ncbi:restriction endonuclease subunit S [Chitinophaga sp. HK235]|uniref:restriction endonuclease subunit S n=1 Tax=Chitinophaga sp. HK235 TaxID=2952571 RepID=UPI001BAC6A78|nr:restriction endonuclease subunit S [Chitinophaga sp. HK235]